MKVCSRCKQLKDKSNFNKDNGKNDGLSSWCKLCKREHSKNRNEYIKYSIKEIPDYKECKSCHKILVNECFNKSMYNIDGLRSYCKDCDYRYNADRKKLIRLNILNKTNECHICGFEIKSIDNPFLIVDIVSGTTYRIQKLTTDVIESFHISSNYDIICLNCLYNEKYKFSESNRNNNKPYYIEIMGSKCEICGIEYNGNNHHIFEFHHLYGKDFSIGKYTYYNSQKLMDELSKCQLLCINCHKQIHASRNRKYC